MYIFPFGFHLIVSLSQEAIRLAQKHLPGAICPSFNTSDFNQIYLISLTLFKWDISVEKNHSRSRLKAVCLYYHFPFPQKNNWFLLNMKICKKMTWLFSWRYPPLNCFFLQSKFWDLKIRMLVEWIGNFSLNQSWSAFCNTLIIQNIYLYWYDFIMRIIDEMCLEDSFQGRVTFKIKQTIIEFFICCLTRVW